MLGRTSAEFSKKFFSLPAPEKNEVPYQLPFPVPPTVRELKEFLISTEGDAFRAGVQSLTDKLLQWGIANGIATNAFKAGLEYFNKLLLTYRGEQENYNNVFFPLSSDGIKKLGAIIHLLENGKCSLELSKLVIKNMVEEMAVCPPGIHTSIDAAYKKLQSRLEDILLEWRHSALKQMALNILRNLVQNAEYPDEFDVGSEVHYVNGVLNQYANMLGIPIQLDDYIPLSTNLIYKNLSTEFLFHVNELSLLNLLDYICNDPTCPKMILFADFITALEGSKEDIKTVQALITDFEESLNYFGHDEDFPVLYSLCDLDSLMATPHSYRLSPDAIYHLYASLARRFINNGYYVLPKTEEEASPLQVYVRSKGKKLINAGNLQLSWLEAQESGHLTRQPLIIFILDELRAGQTNVITTLHLQSQKAELATIILNALRTEPPETRAALLAALYSEALITDPSTHNKLLLLPATQWLDAVPILHDTERYAFIKHFITVDMLTTAEEFKRYLLLLPLEEASHHALAIKTRAVTNTFYYFSTIAQALLDLPTDYREVYFKEALLDPTHITNSYEFYQYLALLPDGSLSVFINEYGKQYIEMFMDENESATDILIQLTKLPLSRYRAALSQLFKDNLRLLLTDYVSLTCVMFYSPAEYSTALLHEAGSEHLSLLISSPEEFAYLLQYRYGEPLSTLITAFEGDKLHAIIMSCQDLQKCLNIIHPDNVNMLLQAIGKNHINQLLEPTNFNKLIQTISYDILSQLLNFMGPEFTYQYINVLAKQFVANSDLKTIMSYLQQSGSLDLTYLNEITAWEEKIQAKLNAIGVDEYYQPINALKVDLVLFEFNKNMANLVLESHLYNTLAHRLFKRGIITMQTQLYEEMTYHCMPENSLLFSYFIDRNKRIAFIPACISDFSYNNYQALQLVTQTHQFEELLEAIVFAIRYETDKTKQNNLALALLRDEFKPLLNKKRFIFPLYTAIMALQDDATKRLFIETAKIDFNNLPIKHYEKILDVRSPEAQAFIASLSSDTLISLLNSNILLTEIMKHFDRDNYAIILAKIGRTALARYFSIYNSDKKLMLFKNVNTENMALLLQTMGPDYLSNEFIKTGYHYQTNNFLLCEILSCLPDNDAIAVIDKIEHNKFQNNFHTAEDLVPFLNLSAQKVKSFIHKIGHAHLFYLVISNRGNLLNFLNRIPTISQEKVLIALGDLHTIFDSYAEEIYNKVFADRDKFAECILSAKNKPFLSPLNGATLLCDCIKIFLNDAALHLLNKGADPHLMTNDNETAFQLALQTGNKVVASACLTQHPIPNLDGPTGMALLRLIEGRVNEAEMCLLLIKAFKQQDKLTDVMNQFVRDQPDSFKNRLLVLAVRAKDTELAKLLLEKNALITTRVNSYGHNCLEMAVCFQTDWPMVKLMLPYLLNPAIYPAWNTPKGIQDIFALIVSSNSDMIDYARPFIEAEINSLLEGEAPLHRAAQRNNSKLISALLRYKNVNINIENSRHNSPLYISAAMGLVENVITLLAHGANPTTCIHLIEEYADKYGSNQPTNSSSQKITASVIIHLLMSLSGSALSSSYFEKLRPCVNELSTIFIQYVERLPNSEQKRMMLVNLSQPTNVLGQLFRLKNNADSPRAAAEFLTAPTAMEKLLKYFSEQGITLEEKPQPTPRS